MSRIAYIDHIKSIAILLVVLTHAHEFAGVNNPTIVSLLYSIDRIGVPLFLIASGILTIKRAASEGLNYIKPAVLIQLMALLIIYSVLTNGLYNSLILDIPVGDSFNRAIEFNNIVIYGENHNAIHLWYLFLYIPIYALAPFIGKLAVNCTKNELLVFMIICMLLNQLPRTIEILTGQKIFLNSFYTDFTGSFLLFYVFGYWYVFKNGGESISSLGAWGCGAVALSIIIAKCIYETKYGVSFLLNWYNNSLSILALGIISFVILYRLTKNSLNSDLPEYISNVSFGVYLIHLIFIIIAKHYILKLEITSNPYLTMMLLFASATLSFPVVKLMSNYKPLRWLSGFR